MRMICENRGTRHLKLALETETRLAEVQPTPGPKQKPEDVEPVYETIVLRGLDRVEIAEDGSFELSADVCIGGDPAAIAAELEERYPTLRKAAGSEDVAGWYAPANATDAARALAEVEGVDLAQVTGTGDGGRITKGDVEAFLAAG